MKGQKEIMGLTKRHLLYTGLFTAALSGMVLGGCTQTSEAPEATASVAAPAVAASPAAINAMPATAPSGEATNPAGTTPPGPPTGAGAPPAGAPPMMGGGNAPFAGGMGGDPNAPLSPSPELDKKIADAEKGKDKKAISNAYTERGAARMYDEKAGQRTKYRSALEDFRKALAADPTNKDAKASKDTIESIYTSMGRPIPK